MSLSLQQFVVKSYELFIVLKQFKRCVMKEETVLFDQFCVTNTGYKTKETDTDGITLRQHQTVSTCIVDESLVSYRLAFEEKVMLYLVRVEWYAQDLEKSSCVDVAHSFDELTCRNV